MVDTHRVNPLAAYGMHSFGALPVWCKFILRSRTGQSVRRPVNRLHQQLLRAASHAEETTVS
ncbi:hypothetical protein M378DRAFT_174198 [Amanita muscaria Koide BX008]|uniref:Uncharacterized protein n=1 Tax=Amanita muscaria (strain Koide BX008) TaxID=946122 RepID=A0A0C2W0A8_AMAMK|nr:hypothetical protein M378DRAFT_174198 [Amanita muscaria Koide BX008]